MLLWSALLSYAQNAPTITTQPTSQTNWAGTNVSFSVVVDGSGPFTYQWQLNGTNLPNQNNIIRTVAGTSRQSGFSGDGGPATNAVMLDPSGVAIDAAGNIFIADQWNNRIRKVSTNGIIDTAAGIGPVATGGSYSGDGGMATNAGLNLPAMYVVNGVLYVVPAGVAVDTQENFYIADAGDSRIREVGTNGIINTIAGTNSAGFSGDGGPAINAKLNSSSGVAVDRSGHVFIADTGNNRVREVDTNGIITTLAGNGSAGYAGDSGAATNASLNHPYGLAVDSLGNVFIADEGNNVIRKVDVTGIITTLAGNGSAGYAGDGGAATNASLNQPYGVAVDAYDDVFIADYANSRIRMVGANGTITTMAGSGIAGYSGDGGVATNANLYEPVGLGLDNYGNLFIAGDYYSTIRKVDFGRVPNLQLNNVSASNAGNYAVIVNSPYGSVTSSIASLTVFSLPTVQPLYQSMVVGSDMSFAAIANGTPVSGYQWQFNRTNIAWATNASLILTNVQAADEGSYDVVISNMLGSITSSNALLFDWATILGTPELIWTSSGNAAWFPESTVSLDGAAAQSGSVSNGGQSILQATVTGPGTLTFWWMFSPYYFPPDSSLSFTTGQANSAASVSSTSGWQQNTFYLGAGTQTLTWAYSRSAFPFIGQSTGFVDQVSFVPGGTSPIITNAPANLSVNMNANVTFVVQAVGTPPLFYQWQFYQTNLVNQTNATLTLLDTQPVDSGNYSVVITNNYGSISTNATLSVQAFAMNTNSTNLLMTTNGLQLQMDGVLTTNPVIVLASTDLVSWLPIFTNSATTGSVQFLDLMATNLPARFYRAQE